MDILNKFREYIENFNIGLLIEVAALFLIGLLVIKILLKLIKDMLERSKIDSSLYSFITKSIKIICLILLLITILSLLGIPTSSFVTVIAAVGAAIALALQDSLSNFAGGLLIMISKPFSRGDLIESNGITGKVQEIGLLYSRLITYDNKIICMPNSMLANNTLINYFGIELRRIDLKISVSYDAEIEHVKSVMNQVVEDSDLLLSDPAPVFGVSDLSDSGIVFDVFVWCMSDHFFTARYSLYENLKKAFDREGIEIPYPQVVVHPAGNAETEES